MTVGTSYFVSGPAAVRYYRDYGLEPHHVQNKIDAGEIHLGKPDVKPGQRLSVIDDGTRYAITGEPIKIKPDNYLLGHKVGGYNYMKKSDTTLWNVEKVVDGVVQLWTINAWDCHHTETCPLSEFESRYAAYGEVSK